jgi:hypothetical protein
MTLYLDRHNGVWRHESWLPDTHRWTLVAGNTRHKESGTVIGSMQNDATMQAEFAPLVALPSDRFIGQYEFPVALKRGDYVDIDMDWLHVNAIDNAQNYNMGDSGVETIRGCVTNHDKVGYTEVAIQILVPNEILIKNAN